MPCGNRERFPPIRARGQRHQRRRQAPISGVLEHRHQVSAVRRELRAQVDAASGLEIDSFMVWDPRVTYSAAGFPDDAEPIKVATRSRPVTPGGLAPEPTAATVPVTVSTSDSPES